MNDKRGELAIFYVAHDDGVPNGYNRTKQEIRWKATGQHLSPEAKADLAAQVDRRRYARKQAERELYEATAKRLVEELQINNSGVNQTAYDQTKQIELTPGAPVRNGDVLVPGYDAGINRFQRLGNPKSGTCITPIGGDSSGGQGTTPSGDTVH